MDSYTTLSTSPARSRPIDTVWAAYADVSNRSHWSVPSREQIYDTVQRALGSGVCAYDGAMSSAHHGEPAPEPSGVTFFPEEDAGTLSVAAWLDLVAGDEPVDLPRPAAEYLAEARSAGEV